MKGFICVEAVDGKAGLCSWSEPNFQFIAEPISLHLCVSLVMYLFSKHTPVRAHPLPVLVSPVD